MYEKIKDDWNEIGEIGGKACDIAASKSHVIIATDKGIYSRGKNDYGLGSIWFQPLSSYLAHFWKAIIGVFSMNNLKGTLLSSLSTRRYGANA